MPDDVRRLPRYREDFPTQVESDHYIKRREFARLLTIGSGLLTAANAIIAALGQWIRRPALTGNSVFIAKASSIATGSSTLFRYPTDRDPCILIRTQSGVLRATPRFARTSRARSSTSPRKTTSFARATTASSP